MTAFPTRGHPCRALCAAVVLALAAGTASGAERYTKIANNGAVLPASATLGSGANDWACTRDNATGLLWEVKTGDGGLRDQDKLYTNYDSFYDPSYLINAATNSIGFVQAVNALLLCGYADWRRPSNDELWGLLDWNLLAMGAPVIIDSTYFPNTPAELFWSSSPFAGDSSVAWVVDFGNGDRVWNFRGLAHQVRLVRAGQFIDHSVSLTGGGAGRVVTDGIDCGVTHGICSTLAWKGSTVTLTATPLPGSSFTAWGGACGGSATTCTLTLTADTTVTAAFSASPATRAIVIDAATPTTLHAAVEGQGIYTSTDSGVSWGAATTQPANTNLRALVITPGDGSKLYAATYGGGVSKSTDSGTSWGACASQPANLNLLTLVIDAAGKLYAGSEAGVFASADDCASWTPLNNGLPN